MDLSKVSNAEILFRLERLARTERKITHLILCHIVEAERRLLYAELGYGSMHEYLVKHLKYADDAAYRRLRAANVLKQVPEVAVKLEEGSLNLTQLTQVQQCLRHEKGAGKSISAEQTAQILNQLENKNNFETKKALAVEFNIPVQMHEVVKPQKDDSVRLEITFTEEQMQTLRRAKELLSHSLPEGSWAEVITLLAQKQIDKVMGKENRREKEFAQGFSAMQMGQPEALVKSKRRYTSITTKRYLLRKANHRCEFVDENTSRRCDRQYHLQVDHCIPFALGGSSEVTNLRILCRTHNLLAAKQWGLRTYKQIER